MGNSPHTDLSRVRQKFLQRVSFISDSISQKIRTSRSTRIWKHRKRFLGGLFLVASALSGVWANEVATSEALLKWERTHLPSEQIFRFAIGSRGFKPILDERKLHRVHRTLPASLDEKGTFWVSADSDWVAYFADPEEAIQAHLYCLRCEKAPQSWQFQGGGWTGLEKVIHDADQYLGRLKSLPVVQKRLFVQDPREILY